MAIPKLILKSGREKSVLRHHPWIFSGAVERLDGTPAKGETVLVTDSQGKELAKAAYSPDSQITARAWTFSPEEEVNDAFFMKRIAAALALRPLPSSFEGAAFRLANAESDGLPGVVVDYYNGYAICQFASAGAELWKFSIAKALQAALPSCKGVYERGDLDARLKEGLPQKSGLLLGGEPPELIDIEENGVRYGVDVRNGHKTGFYLDQRESRKAVFEHAKNAQDVLNCFCYTGGFGLAALKGGAKHAVNIDLSGNALELARRNAKANGLDETRFETAEDDVFLRLRKYRDSRKDFDLIVLDPPKFADSKNHVEKAARGYKDINLLGIKLLRPGGTLFTFSCSAAVDCELFQKIVASAALDAKRELKIVSWLNQAPDHPVSVAFPEGRYLKGLLCKAL